MDIRVIATMITTVLLGSTVALADVSGTVQAIDGRPLRHVVVHAYAVESTEQWQARLSSSNPERISVAVTTTDDAGRFTLEIKHNAVIDVSIYVAGYAPITTRMADGQDAGVIQLLEAQSVAGKISCGGHPAHAIITLVGAGELTISTDAHGAYVVTDPNAWADRLIIRSPRCAALDQELNNNRPFSADFDLTAGVAVRGQAVSGDGRPVGGAIVSLDGWPAGRTSDDGTFSIPNAPSTWHILQVSRGQLLGRTIQQATGAYTVHMRPSVMLYGFAKDRNSRLPIESAEVQITDESPTSKMVVLTDRDGRFQLYVLPGSYTISLRRPGFEDTGAIIEVPSHAPKTLYTTKVGAIVGFLRMADGTAVRGAKLIARGDRRPVRVKSSFRKERSCCFSDATGRFVVNSIRTGIPFHLVGVRSPLRAALPIVALRPGEILTAVSLIIPKGLIIRGSVVDQTGRSLSGIKVVFCDPEINMSTQPTTVQSVTTTNDGLFRVTISPGNYDIVITHTGFVRQLVRAKILNDRTGDLRFVLERGVTVAGRVEEVNHAPAPEVRVSTMTKAGEIATISNVDGSFTLTDLPRGKITIMASNPTSRSAAYEEVDAPTSNAVLVLPAESHIRGRVVDVSSNDPITEFEIGASTVSGGGNVRLAAAPSLQTTIDPEGKFDLIVPIGRTTIIVKAPGYATGHFGPLTVDGSDTRTVNAALQHGVSLTGRVLDLQGSPIPDAVIRRNMPQQAAGFPSLPNETAALSDLDGQYSFSGLPEGELSFSVTAPTFRPASQNVKLISPETSFDFVLQAGLKLTGTVTDTTGAPIAGARIEGRARNMPPVAATADDLGQFYLEGLSPTQYYVQAMKDGYASSDVDNVDVASTPDIHLVLEAGGTLNGQVLGITPADIPQTVIHVGSSHQIRQQPLGTSAAFQIEHLPAGPIDVWATIGAGTELRSSEVVHAEIAKSDQTSVALHFTNECTVQGEVTKNSAPLVGGIIQFVLKDNPASVQQAQISSDGRYVLSGLQERDYLIVVTDFPDNGTFIYPYRVSCGTEHDVVVESGEISGNAVVDGNPTADASIILDDSNGRPIRTAITDATGAFTIDDLQVGTYLLTANKEHLRSETLQLYVNRGGDARVTLHLVMQ